MAAEEHKRWAEFDQRLKQAEKRILTTGNLVRAGIPMIVDLQARLDALIDSDTRLYGRLEQLAESQKKTGEQIAKLVEAQKRTEQSLTAFIDSTKRGGNGNR
jgi:predicted  nucleic acid-binding Zn-ribbon protein